MLLEKYAMNPDQLQFKLARLATGLEADLHGVDCLNITDRFAAKQQKLQLITETLDQVVGLLTPPEPLPCRVWGCRADHIGPTIGTPHPPDSLRDHGA